MVVIDLGVSSSSQALEAMPTQALLHVIEKWTLVSMHAMLLYC